MNGLWLIAPGAAFHPCLIFVNDARLVRLPSWLCRSLEGDGEMEERTGDVLVGGRVLAGVAAAPENLEDVWDRHFDRSRS